jgi:hypothetical protein
MLLAVNAASSISQDLRTEPRQDSAMRIHRSLLLSIAIVTPQLGGAQLPFPNQAFAKFEGTLDFCAKANPKDSEKYEKLKKELVKGASEKDVSEIRETQEYQDAYEQVTSEFSRMQKGKALKACSASLENSK